MNKMKFETTSLTERNIDKIAELFPNCITETADTSTPPRIKRSIDFETLKQMLSDDIAEGSEAYEFTWVGKKAAMAEASKPTRKTLRPCKEESVDWDNTENLYIEGDNLEVLKLLQESYLGKVKMIYIDPPYNTGNDFIYDDTFKHSQGEENEQIGMFDEDANRLFKNTDTNGKFHSDWCSMIYPRLMLARNLLSDDGVIFISIDDNEYDNLKKICDEVFGASNCIGPIVQNKQNSKNDTVNIQKNHEFILVYRKIRNVVKGRVLPSLLRKVTTYRDVLSDGNRFYFLNDPITTRGDGGTLNARPNLGYSVYYNPQTQDKIAVADYDVQLAKTCNNEEVVYSSDSTLIERGYIPIRPPRVRGKLGCWTWALDKFNAQKDDIIITTGKSGTYSVKKRTFVDKNKVVFIDGKYQYPSILDANSRSIINFATNDGTVMLNAVMEDSNMFNNPKNLDMLKYLSALIPDKNFFVLDFFSGSATTAHAVMQLNAEDGGKRKFIMVQLDEKCDEKSEAYKAGYKNICEIGKERIRRAGKKIKEENPSAADLDTGFRVLKLDSGNMEDVYYSADEYTQDMLARMESNIKPDRTDMDLLFGCLLEWGLKLDMPCKSEEIEGYTVHTYNDGDLIACFEENIPESVIMQIAKREPLRAVFRDSSFTSAPEKINMWERFKLVAPDTRVKVI